MRVERLSPSQWDMYAESAHMAVFGEHRPKDMNRFTFALMVIGEKNLPLIYGTFRESDAETIYMQYGGAFPTSKDTAVTYRAYLKFHEYLQVRYQRSHTLISADNLPMLKFAMKAGMRIIGTRTVRGEVLVELMKEHPFEKANSVD